MSTCGLGCGGRGTWAASYLAGLISSVEFQMTNDFILDWEKKNINTHTHLGLCLHPLFRGMVLVPTSLCLSCLEGEENKKPKVMKCMKPFANSGVGRGFSPTWKQKAISSTGLLRECGNSEGSKDVG